MTTESESITRSVKVSINGSIKDITLYGYTSGKLVAGWSDADGKTHETVLS